MIISLSFKISLVVTLSNSLGRHGLQDNTMQQYITIFFIFIFNGKISLIGSCLFYILALSPFIPVEYFPWIYKFKKFSKFTKISQMCFLEISFKSKLIHLTWLKFIQNFLPSTSKAWVKSPLKLHNFFSLM